MFLKTMLKTYVWCWCLGATEAMQHPDHPDRAREHGAGGAGEGREEETWPEDCFSKLGIHRTLKEAEQRSNALTACSAVP